MKTKTIVIFLLLFVSALTLTGCAGGVGIASSWPGLTINQDSAYLAYNQHVYAINLENGGLKWQFPTEKPSATTTFYAAPVLTADGQLLAASYDHKLYSLDSETGQINWTFEDSSDRLIGSPLVTENGIYLPSADGTLYALDAEGQLNWMFKTERALWAQPATNEACDCIFVASMDHHIYALDPENGRQMWKSEGLNGALVGTPTFGSDGLLYVGTFANELIALNAEDGRVAWRVPTSGWVWSGPAVSEGSLYFGDLNGMLYALNAESGAEQWKIQPDGPISGAPLVTEETIYFTTAAGTVYAVDKNGGNEWNVTVGGKLYAPALLADDLLLVTPVESETPLVALTTGGAQRWSFTPPK